MYRVELDKETPPHAARKIKKGILLKGKKTAPRVIKTTKNLRQIYITIHEGRKKQTRKMFEAAGYKVIKLARIQYGTLKFKNLKAGHFTVLC